MSSSLQLACHQSSNQSLHQASQRIAVLGAGPMGLAVAYQLARDGHHPVVFEADDRVGGMTACFDFSGLEIERYYHFHCTSDTAFLQVLDELGIADKMRWTETKMGYWYQDRMQPWGNPWALLGFRGLSLIAKFRYGLHAFLCTKRNDWKPLDHVEATGWIRRWVGDEAWKSCGDVCSITNSTITAVIFQQHGYGAAYAGLVVRVITSSARNSVIWKAARRRC